MAKSRIKFDALSKTLETVMLEHMEPNSGSNSPTSIINASKQPGAISTFSDYSKTNGSNTTAFDLPKQWHKRTDPSNGKPYYFNSDTNYSTYSLEDVLKSDVGSSDGSDSTDRNQPPSDPQPALKTAGSSTSDWGTESLIDDHTQINWEILINNILFCISELNHSAKNDLHELFVTQTNQVICAIRDLLTFTTAVFPEADVLKANPPLLESQQKIMKNLAKLVLASRFGSGLWPPPDSCGRIRYFAGQVLLAVRNFVLYAQKIGIVLNKDIDNQNTSFDQYGTLLAEQELLVRLSNSEKSIVEKLAELKDTLQTTSFADSTKSHMFLIEMHNLIEQVGELMAIIEDVSGSYLEGEEFDPSRYLPSLNKTKDKLYVVLSGMVNIVSSCVNSSKWPSDTVTALNSVILNAKGSVTDVVNATKLVLHNKENLVFKEPLKDGDTVATPETASDIYELIYLRRQTLSISTAIGCNVGQRSALDNTESSKNSGDIDKAVTAPPIMGITTGLSYALNVTGPKIAEESRLYSPINASPLPQQSQPTSDSSSTASPGYHSRPPSRITSTESAFSERDGSKQVPQKHDFLSRDYARNELAFNSKGALVGGTFKALVAYLTIHDRPVDPNFMSVFLLTFHSFSTPFDVFNALVERFNIKQPEGLSETQRLEWEEKKRKPIQIRVGIILRIWLESYWMTPDDDQVIDKLHEFALEKIEPTYTQVFNRLIDVLNRKLDYNRKEIITSSLPRHSSVSGNQPTGGTSQKALPPTPIIPKTSKKMSVLDIDPTEMVRQVTLLEARVFCKIAPVELLDQEWTKSTSRAANVHQMAQMSNKITLWTVSNIVSEADLKKRASILKFFIKVSEVMEKHTMNMKFK